MHNDFHSRVFTHAQVSTKFITLCLGPCVKYSSGLFPTGKESLAEAEVLMFEDYCKKAKLKDGLDILDLGCGELTDNLRQTHVITRPRPC